MPNDTVHEEIESWLAADIHGELTAAERAAFQQHLAGCATCRALQEEEKQMHQLLEDTLAKEAADPALEEFLKTSTTILVRPTQYMDKWRLDRQGVTPLDNTKIKKALGF